MSERIGRGAWARLLASAIVPDEGSATAERGRALVRAGGVQRLDVARRTVAASVGEATVTLIAEPVPPRVWDVVFRSARTNPALAAAVEGREQSVQLEHLMAFDWEEPLVPRATAVRRLCTVHGEGAACEHVAAAAYAVAAAVDRDPSLLLRWRGCDPAGAAESEPVPPPDAPSAAAWKSGPLPEPHPLRPLPVGAVLKSLGTSGITVGNRDLADALAPAYAAFAAETDPDTQ